MTDQKKPILEPKTQALTDALDARGGKSVYELSYADAREVLEDWRFQPIVTREGHDTPAPVLLTLWSLLPAGEE